MYLEWVGEECYKNIPRNQLALKNKFPSCKWNPKILCLCTATSIYDLSRNELKVDFNAFSII